MLAEKIILPVNSEGYVSLMTVKLRLMNNLMNGLQIIGFCIPSKNEDDLIMYNKHTGVLYAVSKNENGITNQLVYGDKKNQSEFLI